MKKNLSLFLLILVAQMCRAINIVVDEPITNPQGKTVSGLVRSASSFFYSSYGFDYDSNKTGTGEYVIGDDGCIYIKEAVSAYNFGTYLKLDKVDDETYVAHTAQIAAVTSDLQPVFIVRLVFKQASETSYSYVVEKDEAGEEITDIYFTFKDGNLEQRDRETIEMNGIVYPHEIIGLSNTASGDWNGYGDGLLSLRKANTDVPTPPAGAEVKPASILFNGLYDYNGTVYNDASLSSVVEDGDNLYVKNPSGDTDTWFKGTINRTEGTVTFLPQYIGQSSENHMWLIPATYKDSFELWDEEDNSGAWTREITATEACVLKYSDGAITNDGNKGLVIAYDEQDVTKAAKILNGFSLKQGAAADDAKPATPIIGRFSPYDDFWWEGNMTYFAAPVDVNGNALDVNELYINLYHDDVTEPYEFKSSDSYDIEENVVDLPYTFSGDSFTYKGAHHRFYFYNEWQDVGIQLVYKHNGNETRSDIAYAQKGVVPVGGSDGIKNISVSKHEGKFMENGKFVIIRNGVKYNAAGMIVK